MLSVKNGFQTFPVSVWKVLCPAQPSTVHCFLCSFVSFVNINEGPVTWLESPGCRGRKAPTALLPGKRGDVPSGHRKVFSEITGALGVLVGWSTRLQRGQRSYTVLAMPVRRLHAKNGTCAVGLVVRGTRRCQAGNRVTLGAWGQSADRAATELLSRAVASWIGLLESPAWLPPGGGMGTGPEADLTLLRTKLLSSEKVLAVLP